MTIELYSYAGYLEDSGPTWSGKFDGFDGRLGLRNEQNEGNVNSTSVMTCMPNSNLAGREMESNLQGDNV